MEVGPEFDRCGYGYQEAEIAQAYVGFFKLRCLRFASMLEVSILLCR